MRRLAAWGALALLLAGCAAREEPPWSVHIVVKDTLGRRGPPPLLVYDDPAYRPERPVETSSAAGTLRFSIVREGDSDHLLTLDFLARGAAPEARIVREVRLRDGYGVRADTGLMRLDIQPRRAQ